MRVEKIENPKEWKLENWTLYNPVTEKFEIKSMYNSYRNVPESVSDVLKLAKWNNPGLTIEMPKFFHHNVEMQLCTDSEGKLGWYDFVDKKFISDEEMYQLWEDETIEKVL